MYDKWVAENGEAMTKRIKCICVNDCDDSEEIKILDIRRNPIFYKKGDTYVVQISSGVFIYRYLYRKGFIGTVTTEFVNKNFVLANEDNKALLEIDELFEKLLNDE